MKFTVDKISCMGIIIFWFSTKPPVPDTLKQEVSLTYIHDDIITFNSIQAAPY